MGRWLAVGVLLGWLAGWVGGWVGGGTWQLQTGPSNLHSKPICILAG
jgi:hypothetical protein